MRLRLTIAGGGQRLASKPRSEVSEIAALEQARTARAPS
jgi:hypothetical protein